MRDGLHDQDRLYKLLPAIYQEQDAAEGYPLRALLRLVEDQARILHADIQQLWDNFFIDTCERWAIPYIGDLVGNNLLYDASRLATADTARERFPDLRGRNLRPDIAIRTRADVAKTIYYRRRKGTLPMLEELARDVTGWAAHAVEFFELLGWTQHLNHLRRHAIDCADLRRVEPLDRLDGPFDDIGHTVDVRPIGQTEGWYNIRNIGFFLWRLRSYPLKQVPARQASLPWRYHFSPLGNPAPLFTRWRREGDEAGLATELHVPGPIRRALFYEDLERYRRLPPPRPDHTDLYGLFEPLAGSPMTACPECSVFIFRNGLPIALSQDPAAPVEQFQPQIICRQLDPWPASQPSGRVIAVDVERGRLAIGDGWGDATTSLDVWFHQGFSADLGGGPYERGKWLVRQDLAAMHLRVKEDGIVPTGAPAVTHTRLTDALADWELAGRPNTIVTILDSRTYPLPGTILLSNEGWLAIEAANVERPLLQSAATGLEVQVLPPAVPGNPARQGTLMLSGVAVEGFVHVTGDLGRLRLLHTTLIPGRSLQEDGRPATSDPSLIVAGGGAGAPINATLRVDIAFSITGPLRLPEHADGLWLLDALVDGLGGAAIAATGGTDQPGPPLTAERATIFGPCYVKQLPLASEVIFTVAVVTAQRQEGCVRFSFVPRASATPRRYRCQPDLEIAVRIEQAEKRAQASRAPLTPAQWSAIRSAIRTEVQSWLIPSFTAMHFGLPGYAQLRLGCPSQIRTGAEDGSEMGVFSHLKQPQRETNLRLRLGEYLPFGLDAGFIYVT